MSVLASSSDLETLPTCHIQSLHDSLVLLGLAQYHDPPLALSLKSHNGPWVEKKKMKRRAREREGKNCLH